MKQLMVLLLALTFACSGCVPTLIGGTFYYKVKGKQEKEDFLARFAEINIKRHQAGLPPLDLCTEKYHFDEGWAKNDPQCKARVEAYEAGDKKALGTSEINR